MFTLMEDVTRFSKKNNVSELKCFLRKWPIDNCHVVSFRLHPAWVNEICTLFMQIGGRSRALSVWYCH